MSLSGFYLLIAVCDYCGAESIVRSIDYVAAWGDLTRRGWKERAVFGKVTGNPMSIFCPGCSQRGIRSRHENMRVVKE